MRTLIYCYDEDNDLIPGATETVRLFDVVPPVGSFIMAKGLNIWEYFQVGRCIFNHKGSGTIDLILRTVLYEDLFAT